MKNDKFCINRTLGYLVVLVVVLVGFFWVMNKANSSNLAINSRAALPTCKQLGGYEYLYSCPNEPGYTRIENSNTRAPRVCCKFTPVTCSSKSGQWYSMALNEGKCPVSYVAPSGVTEEKEGYICCKPGTVPSPTPVVVTCTTLGGQLYTRSIYGSCYDVLTSTGEHMVSVPNFTPPADKWCCKRGTPPTPTFVPLITCSSQGGLWYLGSSCPTGYAKPAAVNEGRVGYVCCKPVSLPTSTPTPRIPTSTPRPPTSTPRPPTSTPRPPTGIQIPI